MFHVFQADAQYYEYNSSFKQIFGKKKQKQNYSQLSMMRKISLKILYVPNTKPIMNDSYFYRVNFLTI